MTHSPKSFPPRPAIRRCLFAFLLACAAPLLAAGPVTEQRYLSGIGPSTAVPWEFKVSEGVRSGAWTTIPVPSNWESHGFGGYDFGEGDKGFTERGQYRLKFSVPPSWEGRSIKLVFEGVMTEASVRVNGVAAGPVHIGGFYRFSHDITALVRYSHDADNLLEVDVSKKASDPLTDRAERRADYWVFGGIFRPVWLEAAPLRAIAHTAIDARADGTLAALVTLTQPAEGAVVEAQVLDAAGKPVGCPFSAAVPGAAAGASVQVKLAASLAAPRLWSAETPHLYRLRLALKQGGQTLHTSTERFGFRTFEVRKGDGLYLNGRKIVIKGVNRHSFRPATARALDPRDNYADARLIKSMNMNTARMSHYPPDPAFLKAADELGLYVINELSGWQAAHGTENGRKLIQEMVPRDVNHPSILFWANGNEGGWNTELDGEYHKYDPQKRPVIHPWAIFSEIDTKHYPNWDLLNKRLQGPHLFLPTEFLHGLYDGGGGAGLNDYWNAMMASPYGVGGVLWVMADEGVQRIDRNNRIDVYSSYAPDGIVGPRHEKEGSYYAVRQIWSPVQLGEGVLDARFDGRLKVENRYDFNSLDQVKFAWRLVRYPGPHDKATDARVLAKGEAFAKGVPSRTSGVLDLGLPLNWRTHQADALEVSAFDPDGAALWTWTYPSTDLSARLAGDAATSRAGVAPPRVEQAGSELRLVAGALSASFDAATGQLRALQRGGRASALSNGPRLAFARPAQAGGTRWLEFTGTDPATGVRRLAGAQMASVLEVVPAFQNNTAYARFKLEVSTDGQAWKTLFDGTRRNIDGSEYRFPPQPVLAVRVSTPVDSLGRPLGLKSLRIGHAAERFRAQASEAALVSSGMARDASGEQVAWIEARGSAGLERLRWTLRGDGALRLDYSYRLDGSVQYHGITFDHPESALSGMRWLGQGPYRVWKNRLQGTWLGVHQVRQFDQQAGETFRYPESQGFFAGVRWVRLDSAGATLTVSAHDPDGYLRVGTPRISHLNTTVEFPEGDVSWLHAIPAIGEKFSLPEALGPSSAWPIANGTYRGSLEFRLK